MPRLLTFIGVLLIATVMIAGPCWYKYEYDRRYRNFHVVDDGKLYRSASWMWTVSSNSCANTASARS